MGGLAATATAGTVAAQPAAGMYRQTNLVSDIPGVARVTDPALVNPWGMSESPSGSPVWVSDNGSDKTTFYSGDQGGSPVSQVGLVKVAGGAPTGQVFNGTGDFVIHAAGKSAPAFFIFDSENGDITGWNPTVSPTTAKMAVAVPGAVYKGLAIARTGLGNFLFAANFHSGQVDMFDGRFRMIAHPGLFEDPHLPPGYAPFNVAVFGDALYVSYAKQDAAMHDDVSGPGHGFIDVYSFDGGMRRRLVSRGPLNSPWGMVLAPTGFGAFGGDLLVGNFGNGWINAFDPTTGAFAGSLLNRDGQPIAIDGLWGLIFGDKAMANPNTLLFSAGIGGEAHGLLGSLKPA
jgi:uncharacterized protein (TIGR03118 family)